MTQRQLISSGTIWESRAGYSRAVRVGNLVHVAGTVAVDEQGELVGKGDLYAQAIFIFHKIGKALESAGASTQDVVRTRMYVTDISQWEAAARAHGEIFAEIRPATTMVEVRALIHPDYLIEIEAEAILTGS